MSKDHKTLMPKSIVLPFEQINQTCFINSIPNENDEMKSISLLLLDSLNSTDVQNSRCDFWKKLFENRNAELTEKLPLIFKLIGIPLVLEKIILEYLLDNKIETEESGLSLEGWAQLTWRRDFKFPENKHFLNFPYENEKLQRLTGCLVEEKQYSSMSRSAVQQFILPRILYKMPKKLIDLIDGYLGENKNINREKRYITEIRKLFATLNSTFTSACGFIMPHGILKLADTALTAIEKNSGFDPFVAGESHVPVHLKNNPNFFTQNSFDCLASIILTDPVWGFAHQQTETKITFFQFVINHFSLFDSLQIKQFSQFFYMVKSIIDSSRIHSGNLPLNAAYHLTKDMARSLYIHVDRRLGLGSQIKSLNNVKDDKPALLAKTLELLGEEVKAIDFRGYNGFSLIPANQATGIRLFNYHKRSIPLDILYNYIKEANSFNLLNWFGGQSDHSSDAKILAMRLLNTPCSGVKEYFLIDEIEKSLISNGIRDPKYKKALEQVKDVLVNDAGSSFTHFPVRMT